MAHRHKGPSAGPDRVLWVVKTEVFTSWAWIALAMKFLQVPLNLCAGISIAHRFSLTCPKRNKAS